MRTLHPLAINGIAPRIAVSSATQVIGIDDLILPSCKKIAGLVRMERAKPVNWSEVESCFARIIQTAFQSSCHTR
jgi:hypothetical protein